MASQTTKSEPASPKPKEIKLDPADRERVQPGRWILDSLISAAIVALVAAIWNMNALLATMQAQVMDIRSDMHDLKVQFADIQRVQRNQ